jgi:nitrogen fixation NifU-like protein
MDYSKELIEHFEHPRNIGSLDEDSPDVGTGIVGAPVCGDVMKLQVEIDESGVIVDAKFKTYGCGSAIASSSLATEWLKGKTIAQAAALQDRNIADELSLPPLKIHCSVLAERAVKAAIDDWKKKHGMDVEEEPWQKEGKKHGASQPGE